MRRMNQIYSAKAGAITVEYALVMAIVVVQLAILCAPSPQSPMFNMIRLVYRRVITVIGMPWL